MPNISVVIPVGPGYEITKNCIESLLKYTDLHNINLIAVINGTEQETYDYLHDIQPKVELITLVEPWGYTRATNAGIKRALENGSDFIILLNNDTVFLEQQPNTWLDHLLKPFSNSDVGITGPLIRHDDGCNEDFIVFFCACISAKLFREIGVLDEVFNPGGFEDVDFCIRARQAGYKIVQVPDDRIFENYATGVFPIFHMGEQTVSKIPNWNGIFERNRVVLKEKYTIKPNHNDGPTIGTNDPISHREFTRYNWCREKIESTFGKTAGLRVLDLGMSSGYGQRILPTDIDYEGWDISQDIIDYARREFPRGRYRKFDLEKDIIDGQWDVILALEIIEHLDNGLRLVQALKNHCKLLLVSVPEKDSGIWGDYHKLLNLTAKDFPGFDITTYSRFSGERIINTMYDGFENLFLSWPQTKKHILVDVCTKDRYFSTLPMTLSSIITQTVTPDKIIIVDDGEQRDLRQVPIYSHLFQMMAEKGINWYIAFGQKRGQHYGHQMVQDIAINEGYDLVWRVDDDTVSEPDCLEKLLHSWNPHVGAVGGRILTPPTRLAPSNQLQGSIKNTQDNPQWYKNNPCYTVNTQSIDNDIDVDHLHCSFIYRPGIAEYNLALSPVAHTEETQFTYEIKRAGYRVVFQPQAITWHLRNPEGGIRSHSNQAFYDHDIKIFNNKLASWGIDAPTTPDIKIIWLKTGLGDHLALSTLIPELVAKYGKLHIVCTLPDAFYDMNDIFVEPWPGTKALQMGYTPPPDEEINIYVFMKNNNWTNSLIDAYRVFYGLDK
jgi:GT2 family glycosyltransferase